MQCVSILKAWKILGLHACNKACGRTCCLCNRSLVGKTVNLRIIEKAECMHIQTWSGLIQTVCIHPKYRCIIALQICRLERWNNFAFHSLSPSHPYTCIFYPLMFHDWSFSFVPRILGNPIYHLPSSLWTYSCSLKDYISPSNKCLHCAHELSVLRGYSCMHETWELKFFRNSCVHVRMHTWSYCQLRMEFRRWGATTVTKPTVTRVYTDAGNFTATLVVTNNDGWTTPPHPW